MAGFYHMRLDYPSAQSGVIYVWVVLRVGTTTTLAGGLDIDSMIEFDPDPTEIDLGSPSNLTRIPPNFGILFLTTAVSRMFRMRILHNF